MELTKADAFVLLHGLGASGSYFQPLSRLIKARLPVLAPDLPGFGSNKPGLSRPSVATLAAAVRTRLEEQGIVRPLFVGHSLGCQVAVELLSLGLPASGAMLLSPTVNPAERRVGIQLWRLLEDSCHEPPRVLVTLTRDYWRCGMTQYLRVLRASLVDKPEEKMDGISQPVLVVRGSRDRIASRQWVEQITARLPHGSSCEVEGAAHGVHLSHTAEVARLCLAFADETGA